MTAALSGGAYAKMGEARGGAGRWEVKDDGEGLVLDWWVEELVSTDRPAVLSGQYYTLVLLLLSLLSVPSSR